MNGSSSPSATPRALRASAQKAYVSWAQVVLASLLMVATLPGRTQGLGLITEPLLADVRVDRVTYASFNLWATLLGATICLPAGWAIDRVGLRCVSVVVLLGLALTVWQFGLLASGAGALFGLLLTTRALGQSALSVCSIAAVARWFPNRAGFAMGVYSVLLSVFFALAFGGVGYAVREHGWRWAWSQMALVLAVGIAPLALFVMRRAPSPKENCSELESAGGPQLTLGEAWRTPAFWTFAGAAAAFNMVSSGLGLFNESVLQERGFDQKAFHIFLIVSTLVSLVGQFACGWLTRWYRYQTLTFVALLLYAAGLALIPVIDQPWQLWGLAQLLGGAGGMIIVVFFSVWSDLFGQRHLGRIQGAAQMITVFSSGLGPLLFAKCFERSGSYMPLLWAISILVVGLSFIARAIPAPSTASTNQNSTSQTS